MVGFGKYPARSEIRESYYAAAKMLNVSEGTLRSRVARLFDSGYLKGWGVFLNPSAIGQQMALVRLDVLPPSAKGDAIKKFRLIEGVWRILNNHGNSIQIGTYYEDEGSLKRKVELMARIANSEQIFFGKIWFPRAAMLSKGWT